MKARCGDSLAIILPHLKSRHFRLFPEASHGRRSKNYKPQNFTPRSQLHVQRLATTLITIMLLPFNPIITIISESGGEELSATHSNGAVWRHKGYETKILNQVHDSKVNDWH